MIILLPVVLTIGFLAAVVCLYQMLWGIEAGCEDPRNIWRSIVSNDVFDEMLEKMFTDSAAKVDEHNFNGGGFTVWIANDYYGFKIDGETRFSYFQKRKFFKELKEFRGRSFAAKVQEQIAERELLK